MVNVRVGVKGRPPRQALAASESSRKFLDSRCYGASGDEIASIGGLLTERWLHRRDVNSPMEPSTADMLVKEILSRDLRDRRAVAR